MYNTEYKKPRNMKEGKNRECVNESFPLSQYQDLPYEIVILHHIEKKLKSESTEIEDVVRRIFFYSIWYESHL